MSFSKLGLIKPLLSAVSAQGYDTPSPIQRLCIPVVLEGSDVMAAAQTGTGKTAGFVLPMLQLLSESPLSDSGAKPSNQPNPKSNSKPRSKPKGNFARALILTPTRELAAQVSDSVRTYGKDLSLKSTFVFGGVSINPQMQRLRGGTDVLVATPGRLLDLLSQNAVKLDKLEILVLDEADRMLDMGFIHDIKKIIALVPKNRQTLMFSATFSKAIRELAKGLMRNAEEISVTPPNSTVDLVNQLVIPAEKSDKTQILEYLVKSREWFQVLVFSRTKHGADRLVRKLNKRGLESQAIHGDKSQGQRTRALAAFKDNKIRLLVATDIAARGIDIDQLSHVVNFDLPHVPEDYVHRIGRTGRAGHQGQAVSLVSHDEYDQLQAIEALIKQVIEREELPNFEPLNRLKESNPEKFKKQSTGNHKKKPKKSSAKSGNRPQAKKSGGSSRSGPKPGRRKSRHNQSKSKRGKKPASTKPRNTSQ